MCLMKVLMAINFWTTHFLIFWKKSHSKFLQLILEITCTRKFCSSLQAMYSGNRKLKLYKLEDGMQL